MNLKIETFGNEKQKQAYIALLDMSNGITEVGYGGAAGGGKTYTGVSWQWIMRNRYPGTKGFFGREELKRLKQTTLETYYKFCLDYNIPEVQRGVYNAQDSVIRFQNGSQILLLDLAYLPSDPLYTRFGSLEVTDGFIDESAEVDSQCITILSTRVGRQKNDEYGLPPRILEGFNPDKGHVYRRYYKPYRDGSLPSHRVFIPALATDNKKLPVSYIEQLKKTDEVTRQRLLYGNFEYDSTPGRLFDYSAIQNMWNTPEIRGGKYLSIDVARKGKDHTVIFEWDGLTVTGVKKEGITQLSELGDKIMQEYQGKIRAMNIIADENGVGGGLIDHLRCQGFINNARPLQPKNANLSTVRNYENLKTQCYFKLAEYVNYGKISIKVSNEEMREKLIEELDVVVEIALDQDGKTKIIKKEDIIEKLGRSPDYADAMMMRMFYEIDKVTLPVEEEKKDNKNWVDLILEPEEKEEGYKSLSAY